MDLDGPQTEAAERSVQYYASRGKTMYVTMRVYRAQEGEEDAIVALHEDWQRHLDARAGRWLSGELLHDTQDPRRFVAIAHYENETAAMVAVHDPEHMAWQRRLESLCQATPECGAYEAVLISGRCRQG